VTCREPGMTIWVQLSGAPHPKNLGGQNMTRIFFISNVVDLLTTDKSCFYLVKNSW